ncbi:hypothetical protein [uncultured Thiodictyon sp.]|uniref:hypothetical protein n=1 Tax=uncultured Thiodictyon sp. TaxID=1846217 RepID=UPI0025FDCC19|nr:hypothetical protein [uncultured Thiodictyon sp.]
MTIDDLIRIAGMGLACEGMDAGTTLIVPPGHEAVPGFPAGRLLVATKDGTRYRYPAAHLVIWCHAQHARPDAQAITTRPITAATQEPAHV